jgi:uroporphyrinogen decarboxylase
MVPDDAVFMEGMKSRRPGYELDADSSFQLVETPCFDDPDTEYPRIMEMGWGAWYAEHLMSVQNPPMTDPAQLQARYAKFGQNCARISAHVVEKGMVPWLENAYIPIFDMLWLIRSMEEFVMDLYDDPGPIMDIVNKYQPIEDEKTIAMMKQAGLTRVGSFPMRCSATFMSTDMFEEYVWPSMSGSIKRYADAGITTIVHADGDWLPMLPYFNELPRGCCHIELDGVTDIEAAYGILQGHHSIRGDVPATILAFGTEDETREYCEKLVTMGMGGGFMLASGCEVPINAKIENLRAFVNFLK